MDIKSTVFEKLVKNTVLSTVSHILIQLKGLLLIPIVIKVAGVSAYGLFTIVTPIVGIIFGLSSLGVGVKSCRYLPAAKTSDARSNLFFPQLYFQLFVLTIIVVFVLFFQGQITRSFLEIDRLLIYSISIYLFFHFAYAQIYKYLRFTSRIMHMSAISVLYAYGYIAIAMLYFYFFNTVSVEVLFLSQALSALLVSLFFIKIVYKDLIVKFVNFNFIELKDQIRIGFPIMINLVVDFILAASDRFILVYFMGLVSVGVYMPAYILGSLILLIPKAVGTVLPQFMSKNVDNLSFRKANTSFNNSIRFYISISIPFIFVILLTDRDILTLIANNLVATEGRYVAAIIAISSVFYGLNIIISQAYMVDLKTRAILKANVLAAVINLLLNIVLLYFIKDILIPALTTLLSFIVANAYLYMNLSKKWMDKDIIQFTLIIILIAAIVFLLTSEIITHLPTYSSLTNVLVNTALFFTIYLALLIMVNKRYKLHYA